MFDIETARDLAAELDSKSAQVIYGLINELKASHQREAALEEGLLDLQLRLSVLLPKPQFRGPEITVTYIDELAESTIDRIFKYAVHRDRITDGPLNTKEDNGTA